MFLAYFGLWEGSGTGLGELWGMTLQKKIDLGAHFGRLGGYLSRPGGHFGPNCWIWNGFWEDFG